MPTDAGRAPGISVTPAKAPVALPIDAALPEICERLRSGNALVVCAPPGSGKTTRIAPRLLTEPWCDGAVWLLGPRRLAVRSAAERMASERGEPVGHSIGYQSRLDSRVGPSTRLIVMTYGVFRQRLLSDPELPGVSAVLFDEVHERALDSDFALALARDAQLGLGLPVRLIAMSATIEADRFAGFLGMAPIVRCEAEPHPLRIEHRPIRAAQGVEGAMAEVIAEAWRSQPHDILAFCPSLALMGRVGRALAAHSLSHTDVHRLWSGASLDAQRAAMRASPAGRRRIVLATAIAESSVTLDGVRCVVDCGLSRRATVDPLTGLTRLRTVPASQATATQRAGRAARQGPGVAYRLWAAAAFTGREPFDPPEIATADLTGTVLDCARWGVAAPTAMAWLTPPSEAGWTRARDRCRDIGAIDPDCVPTGAGLALAKLGVDPPLGAMLLAASGGERRLAADIATLLSDPTLARDRDDLEQRLRWLRQDDGTAARLARQASDRLARRLPRDGASDSGNNRGDGDAATPGGLLARWFLPLLSRRRPGGAPAFHSVGGRAFQCDPASPLASAEWVVVLDAQGDAAGARITLAAALTADEALEAGAGLRATDDEHRYDRALDRVVGRRVDRLGAIILSERPLPTVDRQKSVAVRVGWLEGQAFTEWPIGDSARTLVERLSFAGMSDVVEELAVDRRDAWVAAALSAGRGIADIDERVWHDMMLGVLRHDERVRLDRIAPAVFVTPAGSRHVIRYAAGAPPVVQCRLTALYGLDRHPTVGNPAVPIRFELTSPADRIVHTTSDVPSFWTSTYGEVAKQLRGRYPRHSWPSDPASAAPTLRARQRSG